MNSKYIKSILQDWAEEIAPSSEIDLWPSIQKNFKTRHAVSQSHERGSKTKNISRRIPLIAPITLALFLVVVFVVATPQGRALAQRLLQYFTQTQGGVIPQPTANIALYEVTPGIPVPTATVHPDSIPAFYESCGEYLAPRCSYTQIRDMIDFPIKKLSEIPEGFAFIGATGGPQGISLIYERSNDRVRLLLNIEPWSGEEIALSPIPPTAIVETVQIGTATGEYVRGSWITDAGPNATWDLNSGLQTLRWRDGDVLYTLQFLGRLKSDDTDLDMEWLKKLAKNLTTGSVQTAPIQSGSETQDSDNVSEISLLNNLSDASQQVGFEVEEPSWLPDGYFFRSVSVSTSKNAICMHFNHSTSIDGNSFLHLVKSPSMPLPKVSELAEPADQFTDIETLTIGGAKTGQGVFVRANMYAFGLCGLDAGYREALSWTVDDMNYVIYASMVDPITWMPSRLQLVRIAESLTEIQTVTDDTVDPDRLRSVEEAEELAGFDLVEPTMLPAGENFTYGTYSVEGAKRLVSLNFTNIGITQISGITQTLETSYRPDLAVDELFRIHGQKAYYRQGCRDTSGWNKNCFGTFVLVWQENAMEYRMWGVMSYQMTREVILAIAEGLR